MVAGTRRLRHARGRRRIILTPSYTFTATACAIEWAGFEPAFVDIEPRGWHLDAAALEAAFERFEGKVAGVLACATFGTAPSDEQRAAWRELCDAHDVPLLIDSAPGFGSHDASGRPLGGLGDTEIFSFHATKPFSIGEGGLITTPDADLAARIGRMINFGLEPGTRISADIGMNGKMSELHAAAGLAMLDQIDDVVALPPAQRRASARSHRPGRPSAVPGRRRALDLADLPRPLPEPGDARPLRGARARATGSRCARCTTRRSTRIPRSRIAKRAPLPVTEAAAACALALPMANVLGDDEIARIAALVHAARPA